MHSQSHSLRTYIEDTSQAFESEPSVYNYALKRALVLETMANRKDCQCTTLTWLEVDHEHGAVVCAACKVMQVSWMYIWWPEQQSVILTRVRY